MRIALCLLALFPLALPSRGEVVGREIAYDAGGQRLKGYVAFDKNQQGERPGVLVLHEWWGLNDYARKRADQLAGLGYVALAVDMYGEGKQAAHPDDAKSFASALRSDPAAVAARFDAARSALMAQPQTDRSRLAAIGYCLGGGIVLDMARSGADLKGVASFHGSLATERPAAPGAVKARILVCHGEADQFVPPEQIAAFEEEMSKAGARYRFVTYPGAKHSWTNPEADRYAREFGMPIGYNAEADAASWQDLQTFLDEVFQPAAEPKTAP